MKKNQIKGLKKLATQLPLTKEIQRYSEIKQGYEFSMEEIEKSGIPIEAEKMYVQKGKYRLVDVCHINRLKKAFARNKEKGIIDYIEWVDRNNKRLNELFEKVRYERVSKEIMAVAKKGEKSFWSNLLNFLFAFITVFKKKESIDAIDA
jgi:hypothetical protein